MSSLFFEFSSIYGFSVRDFTSFIRKFFEFGFVFAKVSLKFLAILMNFIQNYNYLKKLLKILQNLIIFKGNFEKFWLKIGFLLINNIFEIPNFQNSKFVIHIKSKS